MLLASRESRAGQLLHGTAPSKGVCEPCVSGVRTRRWSEPWRQAGSPSPVPERLTRGATPHGTGITRSRKEGVPAGGVCCKKAFPAQDSNENDGN